MLEPCGNCMGSGEYYGFECHDCEGSGVIFECDKCDEMEKEIRELKEKLKELNL